MGVNLDVSAIASESVNALFDVGMTQKYLLCCLVVLRTIAIVFAFSWRPRSFQVCPFANMPTKRQRQPRPTSVADALRSFGAGDSGFTAQTKRQRKQKNGAPIPEDANDAPSKKGGAAHASSAGETGCEAVPESFSGLDAGSGTQTLADKAQAAERQAILLMNQLDDDYHIDEHDIRVAADLLADRFEDVIFDYLDEDLYDEEDK